MLILKTTQKYYCYDITILNFKIIPDKNMTITINIMIIFSSAWFTVGFVINFVLPIHFWLSRRAAHYQELRHDSNDALACWAAPHTTMCLDATNCFLLQNKDCVLSFVVHNRLMFIKKAPPITDYAPINIKPHYPLPGRDSGGFNFEKSRAFDSLKMWLCFYCRITGGDFLPQG